MIARSSLTRSTCALCLLWLATLSSLLHAQDDGAPKLTKPPALTHFEQAEYPVSEREHGHDASVVLQLTLDATGHVSEASVQQSAGAAFDEAALAAVKLFEFSPAEIDNVPASIRILYRYDFAWKPPPTTARFVGSVRERGSNHGLAQIEVALDTGEHTLTNAEGGFEFDEIAPGVHGVKLSGPNLTLQQTEETFTAGQEVLASYEVTLTPPEAAEADSDDLEIVVEAPPMRKQVVSMEVSSEQAQKVPGTQGDVLRVVENLPGVGRSAVGSGQLVVWGAAPEDTRVYIDSVPVPRLYHGGGLRSVIASEFVRSVDLIPGGYGAPYGRGLGGIVTVQSRPIESDRLHASVAADLLDASAAVRGPVTDHISVAVAARRAHLNDLLKRALSPAVQDYFPIPRYYDGQLRVRYAASERQTLDMTLLLSGDAIDRNSDDADPARRARESRRGEFQRIYFSYRATDAGGGSVNITPFLGFDASSLEQRFGSTPTDVSNHSVLGGLRASYRKPALPWLNLEVGLDAELIRSKLDRNGSISSPSREGDIRVFGQPPLDQISTDTWQATRVGLAPYIEGDLSLLHESLHVFPGLRLDPYITNVSRRVPAEAGQPALGLSQQDLQLEPRLSLRYAPVGQFAIKAAWGIYHQLPQAEDLSASFGNPSLRSARAMHWVLGANWTISSGLEAEVTGFYESLSDLIVRSPASSPAQARALVQEGEGRAYGAQVMLRQQWSSRLFGWLSYSIVRSLRRDQPDAKERVFDYDQTHVLTCVLSYDLGLGFELGARARYASGFPRTPVIDAFYDARRDRYSPVFGEQNSLRIPAFFQLDVRIAKRFDLGNTQLDVYLDVQNVSYRSNPEEIVYNSTYSERRYITGLPILPVLGLKWTL